MKRLIILLSAFILLFSSSSSIFAQVGKLSFDPAAVEVDANAQFTSDVIIDTDGADVGGAGVIIKYNPTFLEIVSITPGVVFDDYPLLLKDNDKGEARISGISGSNEFLYNGKGTLATITWRGKANGVSTASFEYTQGSTTDSNIAVKFGNGDILGKVGDLNVTILVGSGAVVSPTPSTSPNPGLLATAWSKITGLFGTNNAIDPYDSISRKDPNTELAEDENISFVSTNRNALSPAVVATLTIILIAIVVTIIVIIIVFIVSKRKRGSSQATVVQQGDSMGQPKPPLPPTPMV